MTVAFLILAALAVVQLWSIRRVLDQMNTNYVKVETARAAQEAKS